MKNFGEYRGIVRVGFYKPSEDREDTLLLDGPALAGGAPGRYDTEKLLSCKVLKKLLKWVLSAYHGVTNGSGAADFYVETGRNFHRGEVLVFSNESTVTFIIPCVVNQRIFQNILEVEL